MNTKLLLLALSVAAFSSCTTLYKSGQTPDDVYFSPARPAGGYIESNRDEDRYVANAYNSEYRTVRLGIYDPRFRYLNYGYSSDFYLNDYSYSPYIYGFNYGYYYNPFYYPYPVYGYTPVYTGGGGKLSLVRNTTPRMSNLASYTPVYNNSSRGVSARGTGLSPARTYNNNNSSRVGNVMRQIFTPTNGSNNNSNSSNNNNTSNNNRSYTPSTSSSSSSGSSSSGGGGISRPPRN